LEGLGGALLASRHEQSMRQVRAVAKRPVGASEGPIRHTPRLGVRARAKTSTVPKGALCKGNHSSRVRSTRKRVKGGSSEVTEWWLRASDRHSVSPPEFGASVVRGLARSRSSMVIKNELIQRRPAHRATWTTLQSSAAERLPPPRVFFEAQILKTLARFSHPGDLPDPRNGATVEISPARLRRGTLIIVGRPDTDDRMGAPQG